MPGIMGLRYNFRGGGEYQGGRSSSGPSAGPAGGASSGGNYGGNRNENQNYGGNVQTAPGGDRFAKDDPMLAEKIDTVTQKYSGDGLFGGYRNLDRRGQPLMGLAYLGDRIKSFGSKINPLSLIGGIVAGPFGSMIGRGITSLSNLRDYDTLKDFAQGELGMFQPEYAPTVDIRDKFNRVAGIENITLGEMIMDARLNNNITSENIVRTGPFNSRLSNLRNRPTQYFQNVPPTFTESLLEDEETLYP